MNIIKDFVRSGFQRSFGSSSAASKSSSSNNNSSSDGQPSPFRNDNNDYIRRQHHSRGSSNNSRSRPQHHGMITSALWAMARTPALVDAIEREETGYGGEKQLTPVLRALGHYAVLSHKDLLLEAAENANAYLAGSTMPLFDSMEPLDAIRGIIGLCGDSTSVFEKTLMITYQATIKCAKLGCAFTSEGGRVREEGLQCTRSTAKLMLEARAYCPTRKTNMCGMCCQMCATETFEMEVPPVCLVASWSPIVRVEPARDVLRVRRSGSESEMFTFRLSALITTQQNKIVCVFRNGQDYYRVQGHDLQQIQTAEWLNAKPRMAIFVLDDCDRAAALAGPGAGIGRRQAWKRRRVEVRQPSSFPRLGHGGDGGGGVVRMSSSSPAEVIEVKDDDSDHEENTCEIIPATAVVGDTPAAPAAAAGHRAAGNNGGGGCNNDCDAPVVIPATAVPAARGRSAESNRDLSLAWAAGGEACGEGRRRRARRSPSKLLGAHSGAVGSSADKALRVSFGSDNNNDDLYKDDDDDDAGTRWSAAAAREQGISAADMAVSKSFRLATDVEADARPAFYAATAESLCGSSGPDASRCSSSSPPAWTPCTTRGARGVGSDGGIGNARGGAAGRLPSEPGHEDLTTRDDGQETDEGDDDVQVVANGQAGPGSDAGGGTGGAASPSTPYVEGSGRAAREERDGNGEGNRDGPNCAPSTKGNVFAAIADDASLNVALGLSLTYRSGEGRPLELSASTGAETADDGGARPVGAERAGAAAVRSSDTSFRQSPTRATPQRRLADQQQQLEREVHDVDDDVSADSPPLSDNTAMKMKHPSGVSMPFIGPARPPPPPRLDTETVAETSPRLRWLSPSARPTPRPLTQNSEKRKRERGTGGVGGVGGGRTSEPAQRKIAWGRTSPLLALAPDPGGGEADEDEEWTPSGRGDKSSSDFGGGGAATSSSIKTRSSGVGGGGGGGGEGGGGAKAMEDLTGAEHGSSREEEEEREAVINRGRAWASRLKDGSEARGDEATLTTIRGINLRQDHFDRIVDSDGWLTSQIIDIRVKQLQEKYPQHLYFDSSFFGFLCPTNDKGGAFVVDYARVRGWTKSSRLPPGKSSLFEMQKLFIPINQGNVHWVLIVVDFGFPQDGGVEDVGGKGGRGGGRKTVSFFDSFGRDGTSYVEAVQEYLVHELSSRDETRQGLFFTEPRPPDNAPRQHNRSDCGVLMLHVMEEMSTNQGETLSRLTQEQIMSLRLELVAKIIE